MSSVIHDLEALTRAGKFDEARRRLRDVAVKKIPRDEALAYAHLANRVGLPRFSLKILNPLIRGKMARSSPPSALEKVQYANSLNQLGAVREAMDLLKEVDRDRLPQARLQLAFCLFSQWDYRSAIPELEAYVRSLDPFSYAMQVGKINLLAAYVHEESLEKAGVIAEDLRREVERSEFPLLFANILELSAQLEIARKDWDRAALYLEGARRSLPESRGSVHALFIKKWMAIIGAQKAGRVTRDLLMIKKEATERCHWETIRECDFHVARLSHDSEAQTHLYFGTPFESYRKKILRSLDPGAVLPDFLDWMRGHSPGRARIFDLSTAAELSGGAILAPGQALHRLLIILCRDFYKPIPLLSIFSQLFPDEHFNPSTSPNRAHQVIKRLRQWIRRSSLPLELEENSGGYRLLFNGSCSIRIPRKPLSLIQKELEFVRLRSRLKERTFTTSDALRVIPSSKSATKRLLKWAVDGGKLELEGWGPSAKYKLSP